MVYYLVPVSRPVRLSKVGQFNFFNRNDTTLGFDGSMMADFLPHREVMLSVSHATNIKYGVKSFRESLALLKKS